VTNRNDATFHYSLIISLSLHAFALWLIFNRPVKSTIPIFGRTAPRNVISITLVPPSELLTAEFPSSGERREQGTTDVRDGKIMSSRSRISPNSPLPQSTESSLADTEIASTPDVTGASDEPGETVDSSDRGITISKGITSGKETPGRSAVGVNGSAGSSGSSDSDVSGALGSDAKGSATPSDVDSFSGAVIPGYVIDTAGHHPPEAGAIYPDIDKYILYKC
jgi:hypothetical protein